MAWRLIEAIKAAETRIIFLDELQHLIDKTGSHASVRNSEDVLSFLSKLADDLNLPLVLIGLPEETNVLLQFSPKLASRMQAPSVLDSYAWDISRPETIHNFCKLMHVIDRSLPLDWSELGTEEMASRFFLASDGNLRRVMRLIRSAANQAIEEDTPTLTMKILAESYERVLASTRMGKEKTNPFKESAC